MRRHVLALFVVALLAAPSAPASGGQADQPRRADALQVVGREPPDPRLDYPRQLMHRGDFSLAAQAYSDAESRWPDLAPRALLLQARATLTDGDTAAAEDIVQQLLAEFPNSSETARAYFTLEQIRRAAGDCAGALRALDSFDSVAGAEALGPYLELQRAQCSAKLGDWTGELAHARLALAIEGGGPRLTRIEALERAAEADLKLGRKQDALDLYNGCLALAATRAYTAEMLFTTATIARALDDTSLAADRFRSVVQDYADQARAPGALDALVDMDQAGTVSPLQAGVVRLKNREYRAAVSQFDLVDASDSDWGDAQLNRAEALLELGDEELARAALQAVTQSSDAAAAGKAWLRLGQLDEKAGDLAQAESRYAQMAQVAPDRAGEARFHLGFTRFLRGDVDGAIAAWRAGLGSGPPSPDVQAELHYWLAKALPSGSGPAVEAFNRAAAAAPESFYGLRAQEMLNGSLTIAAVAPSSNAWLSPSASEIQARDAWFAALGTTRERVASEVNATQALQRADTLLDLGLRAEASWEIEGLVQQYVAARDIAHMSAVADWAAARDQPQLTLRIGKQMRDLVGLNGLPRALQRLVYPAGWGDLVAEQATAFGVDPLLLLALIRQESSFDPQAQSGAQAMGLTQIIPSTARNIASRLGQEQFALRDLFKPAVSVQFGTWFLSQLLGDYKGRTFPTLAAYDAGGGNVARWLQRYGDDPDVLAEEIPFTETRNYVRIVYDNYWHYRALYGSSN